MSYKAGDIHFSCEENPLSEKRVRFVMIGGFLGAGKTTAIARIARQLVEQGQRVGLVTNDQAYNLVDTESLRAQGFDVGEVPGACFCCKFDDLVATASAFKEAPDWLIAEPVGSCTDLAATVIEPLRHLYGEQFEIGPLAVLLKPEHGRKILREGKGRGFSPQAEYIFLKQLEEADIIGVNKIDKLSEEDQDELIDLVSKRFPDQQCLPLSGKTGVGIDDLLTALGEVAPKRSSFMEVDYDVYAAGEAELGWLNCQATFASATDFSLDQLVLSLVKTCCELMGAKDIEPAHLKVLAQRNTESAIANLVSTESGAELSLESGVSTQTAECTVNARAAGSPEQLEELVIVAINKVAQAINAEATVSGMQRFRPGRPEPTHRMK